GINPYSNNIYISDAKDFVQNSSILRYSKNGLLLGSFQAGIISGGFLFLP
ncbi:MAG: cell surface protein, partial [Flavobacteriales bacterium CG_4_10_14_0_8_um_filter_32_5]